MAVRLLLACGSGIVTSTILEQRVKELVDEEKLKVTIKKVGITSLPNYVGEADLIITTCKYTGDVGKAKLMSGTPVITGIGEEKFTKDFVKAVKELQG